MNVTLVTKGYTELPETISACCTVLQREYITRHHETLWRIRCEPFLIKSLGEWLAAETELIAGDKFPEGTLLFYTEEV